MALPDDVRVLLEEEADPRGPPRGGGGARGPGVPCARERRPGLAPTRACKTQPRVSAAGRARQPGDDCPDRGARRRGTPKRSRSGWAARAALGWREPRRPPPHRSPPQVAESKDRRQAGRRGFYRSPIRLPRPSLALPNEASSSARATTCSARGDNRRL